MQYLMMLLEVFSITP